MSLHGFYIAETIHPLILRKMKAVQAAGGSNPADKVIYAESQFIRDFGDEWSKVVYIVSFLCDQDIYSRFPLNAALFNSMTKTGSPTLVNFKGWKPDSPNGDTNNLVGPASYDNFGMSTTNISLGAFCSEVGALGSNFNIAGGLHSSETGTMLQYLTTGLRGTAGANISSIASSSAGLVDNDYVSVHREDNTAQYLYLNGSQIGNSVSAAGSQSTQTSWRALDIVRVAAATGAPADFTLGGLCLARGGLSPYIASQAFKNLKIRVN